MRGDALWVTGEGGEAPAKKKVVYGKRKPAPKKPGADAEEEAAREAAAAAEAAAQEAEEQQRLAQQVPVLQLCSGHHSVHDHGM